MNIRSHGTKITYDNVLALRTYFEEHDSKLELHIGHYAISSSIGTSRWFEVISEEEMTKRRWCFGSNTYRYSDKFEFNKICPLP